MGEEEEEEEDTAHTSIPWEVVQVDSAAEGNFEDMLDLDWVRILVAAGCVSALVDLVAQRESRDPRLEVALLVVMRSRILDRCGLDDRHRESWSVFAAAADAHDEDALLLVRLVFFLFCSCYVRGVSSRRPRARGLLG